jgi:hypothetical protein
MWMVTAPAPSASALQGFKFSALAAQARPRMSPSACKTHPHRKPWECEVDPLQGVLIHETVDDWDGCRDREIAPKTAAFSLSNPALSPPKMVASGTSLRPRRGDGIRREIEGFERGKHSQLKAVSPAGLGQPQQV